MENKRRGGGQLRLLVGLPLPVQWSPDKRSVRSHRRIRYTPRSLCGCKARGDPISARLFLAGFNPGRQWHKMTVIEEQTSVSQRAAVMALHGGKQGGLTSRSSFPFVPAY